MEAPSRESTHGMVVDGGNRSVKVVKILPCGCVRWFPMAGFSCMERRKFSTAIAALERKSAKIRSCIVRLMKVVSVTKL